MVKFGPYTERELADKLVKIPKEEMMAFHNARMKKNRIYYILGIVFGIISVVIFFYPGWQWISAIIAIVGFILFGYGSYKRKKWQRLFENLIYLKRKRQKTLEKKEQGQRVKGKKFEKLKKYKREKFQK